MRKHISVTDERVIEIFKSCENVSRLVEKAILHYHSETPTQAPVLTQALEEVQLNVSNMASLIENHSRLLATLETQQQELLDLVILEAKVLSDLNKNIVPTQ